MRGIFQIKIIVHRLRGRLKIPSLLLPTTICSETARRFSHSEKINSCSIFAQRQYALVLIQHQAAYLSVAVKFKRRVCDHDCVAFHCRAPVKSIVQF